MPAVRRPPRSDLPASLEVRVDESITGLGRVIVTGELDLHGAPTVLAAIRQTLPGSAIVVIDLRGLTFCDTSGVHAVLEADGLVQAAGGRLAVLPAISTVHRVFELTGADRLLQLFGTPAATRRSEPAATAAR